MSIKQALLLSSVSICALSTALSPLTIDLPTADLVITRAVAEGEGAGGGGTGAGSGGDGEGGGDGDPSGGDRGHAGASGSQAGGGQDSDSSASAAGSDAGGQGGSRGDPEGVSVGGKGASGTAGQSASTDGTGGTETVELAPTRIADPAIFLNLPSEDPYALPAKKATTSAPFLGKEHEPRRPGQSTASIEEAYSKPLPDSILSLQEAAEGGDIQAQFTLAVAYEKGLLVAEDVAWAARWYGRAAYQGHSEAQYVYANLKLAGIGTNQDLGRAYRWMTIAAQQGHRKAKEASAELEIRLEISALYQELEWASAFKPMTNVSQLDPATVEYVQMTLAKLGYDPGPPDGLLGPHTNKALEMFMKDQNLTVEEPLSNWLLQKIRDESSKNGT